MSLCCYYYGIHYSLLKYWHTSSFTIAIKDPQPRVPPVPCMPLPLSPDPQGFPRIQLKGYWLTYQGYPESCSSPFMFFFLNFNITSGCGDAFLGISICSNSCILLNPRKSSSVLSVVSSSYHLLIYGRSFFSLYQRPSTSSQPAADFYPVSQALKASGNGLKLGT